MLWMGNETVLSHPTMSSESISEKPASASPLKVVRTEQSKYILNILMSLLNIPWVRVTSVMLRTAYIFGSVSLSGYTDKLHWTFRSPVSIADGTVPRATSFFTPSRRSTFLLLPLFLHCDNLFVKLLGHIVDAYVCFSITSQNLQQRLDKNPWFQFPLRTLGTLFLFKVLSGKTTSSQSKENKYWDTKGVEGQN